MHSRVERTPARQMFAGLREQFVQNNRGTLAPERVHTYTRGYPASVLAPRGMQNRRGPSPRSPRQLSKRNAEIPWRINLPLAKLYATRLSDKHIYRLWSVQAMSARSCVIRQTQREIQVCVCLCAHALAPCSSIYNIMCAHQRIVYYTHVSSVPSFPIGAIGSSLGYHVQGGPAQAKKIFFNYSKTFL